MSDNIRLSVTTGGPILSGKAERESESALGEIQRPALHHSRYGTRIMRRALIVAAVVVGGGTGAARTGRAQVSGESTTDPALVKVPSSARNTLFAEAGGPGILYSVNYDRMLTEMFSVRVGATYFRFHELHDDSAGYAFAPVVANLLVGSARHKLEVGLGVVPGWAFSSKAGDTAGFQFHEVASVGYRYVPAKSGVSFRANAEVLNLKAGIIPWGALSLGYAF
jgi:hypothetical protein